MKISGITLLNQKEAAEKIGISIYQLKELISAGAPAPDKKLVKRSYYTPHGFKKLVDYITK